MRGDDASEDVDEDWSSHDERIVGDVDGFDFPLPKGVSPTEQLRRSPRLVLPKFRLEMAALRPESLLFIFSRSKPLI